jgi:hypothetical protein
VAGAAAGSRTRAPGKTDAKFGLFGLFGLFRFISVYFGFPEGVPEGRSGGKIEL